MSLSGLEDFRACNDYYLVSYMLQICAQILWLGEQVRLERLSHDHDFAMYCNIPRFLRVENDRACHDVVAYARK
jgi:hypothetical protein